jgi:hypothetical protein
MQVVFDESVAQQQKQETDDEFRKNLSSQIKCKAAWIIIQTLLLLLGVWIGAELTIAGATDEESVLLLVLGVVTAIVCVTLMLVLPLDNLADILFLFHKLKAGIDPDKYPVGVRYLLTAKDRTVLNVKATGGTDKYTISVETADADYTVFKVDIGTLRGQLNTNVSEPVADLNRGVMLIPYETKKRLDLPYVLETREVEP